MHPLQKLLFPTNANPCRAHTQMPETTTDRLDAGVLPTYRIQMQSILSWRHQVWSCALHAILVHDHSVKVNLNNFATSEKSYDQRSENNVNHKSESFRITL